MQTVRTSQNAISSDALAPHLPYLRRYARALTGSQKSGDAYVRATLEALLAQGIDQLGEGSPRVALFRFFHRIWLDQPGAGSNGANMGPDQLLQSLPVERREALLLTAVENFSSAETADILGLSEEEVRAQVLAAEKMIDAQLQSRVLVIEDELVIALDLKSLVEELGHEVVGIARTKTEAVAMTAELQPRLILADIRLADGSSGLDAVTEILESLDVPVIFITAYPERLLSGERPEPTYLVPKPFQPDSLKATIGQALFFHPTRQSEAL